jgi:spoIIIJ-associated protein
VTETLRVEAEGETVGEAKWGALRELERRDPGIDKAAVRFEVLSEGQRGLLGVGYSPARVVATVEGSRQPAPREPAPRSQPDAGASEPAARARELVERIIAGIGVAAEVSVREDDETIVVTCAGRDLGVLIGRHGHTIDAVQFLVNAIAGRDGERPRKDIVVDASGYRERRAVALEALALRAADRARETGGDVPLEAMTAVERKVVHLRLRDEPGIETASEGAEPNRHVVVRPTAAEPPTGNE